MNSLMAVLFLGAKQAGDERRARERHVEPAANARAKRSRISRPWL